MTGVRVAHVATVDLTVRFLLLPQLRRLRDEGYEVTAISAPGPWVGDIEAEGIRFLPWTQVTRSWDPRADVRASRELLTILRRERFDLVHTHNPKPGVIGRVAARLAGTPCVVNTVHGLWAMPEDRPLKKAAVLAAEAVASRTSDLELYQSEADLSWARRRYVVRRGRSRLLGNGTDLERFDRAAVSEDVVRSVRAELGVADALVVGTIGRLVAEKGYVEFLEAAARVRRRHPEVRFVALGDVDPSKEDTLGPNDIERGREHVVFAGWREDVRDVLAAVDVFVLASWREGVPRSAIEAAAMGLPLILTDIRGCREVVRDGIEGSLVPPRDAERLASAIDTLVRDPELRRTMGKAARARAEQRFDERHVSATILDAYRLVLARRGLRAPRVADVTIRAGVPRDAPALASLHRMAMPTAFLPSLGDGFLRRLYRTMLADPASVVLVAEDADGIVGAASATASVGALYRRFAIRAGVPAAAAAARALVNPGVIRRARETARYPASSAGLPNAELLSITVAERGRRLGIGASLTRGIVAAMAHRRVDEIKVVVDAANAPANALYRTVGFALARTIEVHAGTVSNVWVIPCRSSSPSPSVSS